ncbi:n-Acetylglucosaminyltransferase-IV (GnT-IV) conserved region domain-containing protein [Phthorimaea operculella]|nr:n-Acetylglucosaminyltransferase-IV (GnT-IV) conserved region domain-containing protein [Phthorimaea operculella]
MPKPNKWSIICTKRIFNAYQRKIAMRCLVQPAIAVAGCACAPRKRMLLLLLAGVVTIAVTTILNIADTQLLREEMLELKLADMRNELDFLMSLYKARHEEVLNLQMELQESSCKKQPEYSHTTITPATANLLRHLNISNTRLATGLHTSALHRPAFVFQLLPHQMNHPRSLYPGFHLKSMRNFTDYVIGIPTVRRDKENYLLITLENLLAGLKKYEDSTLIVICVGETDLEYVVSVAKQVNHKFPKQVESGLIEIISPSPGFYPDFSKDRPTLGDAARRYRWRTKQNLDALFLMAYAQTKGTYYLMLEDDIISKANYMDTIRRYTTEVSVKSPDWVFIEYCTTGGIGKLFKSSVLMHFLIYLELFYRNMPIDWLIEKYLENRECGLSLTPKDCAKAKLSIRPRYSSSLFTHIGLYSSLKGKIHKIKENKLPVDKRKFFPHMNPPIQAATTSIKTHGEWHLMSAYLGHNFWWGIKPNKSDTVEFFFEEPTYVESFLFRSGNVDHVGDRFLNTVVEVIPSRADQNATVVGSFDEFGLAEGTIKKELNPIMAIRIRVEKDLKTWIWLTTYDDPKKSTAKPELELPFNTISMIKTTWKDPKAKAAKET